MPWFLASAQLLTIEGVRDPVTSAYVNTATIKATMYHGDGVTPVTGQTWPLVLSYIPASNGNYNGVLDKDRVLEDGRLYWIEIEANAGGDLIKTWRWHDTARYRVPDDDA